MKKRCFFSDRSPFRSASIEENVNHTLSIFSAHVLGSIYINKKLCPPDIYAHVNTHTAHVILLKAAITSSHINLTLNQLHAWPAHIQAHKTQAHTHTQKHTCIHYTVKSTLPLIKLNEYTRGK